MNVHLTYSKHRELIEPCAKRRKKLILEDSETRRAHIDLVQECLTISIQQLSIYSLAVSLKMPLMNGVYDGELRT